MNESEFARLARQYIAFLDRQNDMKPFGWSQEDRLTEIAWRHNLLGRMYDALGERTELQRALDAMQPLRSE